MIGKRIKELRLEMGLTQKQLAEKTQCTNKSIWAYENGTAVPPVDVLVRMANCFECSLDFVVGRSNDVGNVVMGEQGYSLTRQEKELVANFRKLTEKKQNAIANAVYVFANNSDD